MRRILITALLLCLSANLSGARAQQPEDVSIVRLIASPREFHGRTIRVIGYVRIEFEGTAVYLHRDDETQGITKNAVWLSLKQEDWKTYSRFDRTYVIVVGTFNAEGRGHFGMYSGSIDVTSFRGWKTHQRRGRRK